MKFVSSCCSAEPKGGLTIDPTEAWFGATPKRKGICKKCNQKATFKEVATLQK